jgi:hypothetical protein
MARRPKKKLVVTRATDEDIKSYLGKRCDSMPSMVAWCGKVEGKIIIIGGYFRQYSRWHCFLNFHKPALRYKWEIAYWAQRSLQHARKSGIRYLYAELDSRNPGASAWLMRLGFHLDPRTLYYFRWKAK